MNNHTLEATELSFSKLFSAEHPDTLELAVRVATLGIWDWDIPRKFIRYNDEYLKMLGYSQEDMNGSFEEWKLMHHPEDLKVSMQMMKDYLDGKVPMYECEARMRHRDGSYIWARDVGAIVERDSLGIPTRLIGGHLNIDKLKLSEKRLAEALKSLECNSISLENAIEKHNIEMVEQGKLLWTVNQISRKLLAVQSNGNFDNLVLDCLRLLGESIDKNRVYIWKDFTDEAGKACCSQIYEWARGVAPIQGNVQFEQIPYENLPIFDAAIGGDQCLNCRLCDFSESEKRILMPQGIETILIAPIAINGKRWGFIGVDNCENEQLFTSVEESMLLMSGSMLASAIEKMETEAALREMEERTQIMLNSTPLCCNLWTTEFYNMSCNDEAVRLFELSSQREYLERFNELSPEFQPCGKRSSELSIECISKAFQEGYCRFEWLHQKLDGTPIPAEITLVRIKYKDSFIVAGYTRDLREQKAMLAALKTKEALRRARDEALLNSKAKSNFLANMSHEIRTPMNAISGFAEIILRGSTDEKTCEYAKGIKGACSNLINIVNDILDISKIESGKLEFFNSPYVLASLVNDVIAISRMRLGEKPLMFITDIDSHLPARLIGDEIRIKQILLNIVGNAIKYTQEGYVSLRITSTLEENRAVLRFSVKDSGVGIKPEHLEQLFEEFERVNTTKNRSIEGTGLGLAISKQLCEMMGGYIEVESTYGKGSEFIAVIPQECPTYERFAQVKEEKSVLLYEPRELYRFSIAKTLNNLDCKCVSCANQSELYNSIDAMPYDYILTAALHLKKVKAIVLQKKLPALVAAFADYGETVSDGKVPTILFPVNCLQLSALLNGQHEEGSFSRYNAASINFVAPSAHVLVVDDNPVNLQVAKGLMAPYQFEIETAENGLEAVEMVKHTEYDLVFMDHMMPVMDGVDATVAIRKLEGECYQSLPIIALTANALVGTREMFIREGMNDFLAKPIELNKLAHLLMKWLPKSKIVKNLPQEPAKAEERTPVLNIAGVNTAQGILSVGGSKENYLQILAVFYADGKQKLSSLLQHIVKNNIEAFRTEVHALKSASATIGAMKVSWLAAALEDAAQGNDVAFIDTHIEECLNCLKAVLEAIRPILPGDPAQVCSADGKTAGDVAYLEDALDLLNDAVELVNINLIEEGLNRLQEFTWPEEIAKELLTMQKHLNVYDYDSLLECVAQLKWKVFGAHADADKDRRSE